MLKIIKTFQLYFNILYICVAINTNNKPKKVNMIEIKITLSLDDETKVLVQKLTRGIKLTTGETQEQATVDDEQRPSKKPQPIVEEPEKPAAKPAPQPITKQETTISLDDIRKEVTSKVNDHREAIKNKLNELGLKRVTELNQEMYDDFYNFLKSL